MDDESQRGQGRGSPVRFSVCIPSVRTSTLEHSVAAIMRQTFTDWELLVVGQGRDEEALRLAVLNAAGNDPRVRYEHIHAKGVSRARNHGIAQSRGEILAFTDDDCEPAPDWLEVLDTCFKDDPTLGLVGGSLLRPQNVSSGLLSTCPVNEPAEARYEPRAAGGRRPQGWDWVTANVAVRRSVVDEVGPFDEGMGPGTPFPSGEDTDWKFRLEGLGVVMLTSPRVVVHHTYGVRSGIREGMKHSRNYARGNAAMAAKLTLLGDPFGRVWRAQAMRGTRREWRKDVLPHRIPVAITRRWHFERAYRQMLVSYEAGPDGLLHPLPATATRPASRAGV